MNGHPRDATASDLATGRPTLSPEADDLARKVMALMSVNEREDFARSLDAQVAESAHWATWSKNPDRYLADLDPDCVSEMTSYMAGRYDRLRQRALKRGWEVPD
jgi:hypothetical protein